MRHNSRLHFLVMVSFAVALIASPILLPQDAHAAGFATARFGGGRGTVVDANAGAIYYNPAAMSFSLKGSSFMLDGNFSFRRASFTRSANQLTAPTNDSLTLDANTTKSKLNNFIIIPMAGGFSDFGTDLPFRVGAAFFIPFGGSAVWGRAPNEEEINKKYYGSGDGSVRWFSIDGTIQTMAFALAASYQFESIRLSLGASFTTYLSDISTLRARTFDGSDSLAGEGRSYLKGSSVDFGMGLGAMWEPIKDRLWLGFSWQSRPNVSGKMAYTGTLVNSFKGDNPAEVKDIPIQMTTGLPDIYRFGLKSMIAKDWEIKLIFDYTRWSAMQSQCVVTRGEGDRTLNHGELAELCATNKYTGKLTNETPSDLQNYSALAVFQRQWEDTFSMRFDLTWYALPWLTPSIGASYDTNAVPDQTLDPALMDMRKATASVGATFTIMDWLDIHLQLLNVFYFDRDNSKLASYKYFEAPSTQPGNGGKYTQANFIINTNVGFEF